MMQSYQQTDSVVFKNPPTQFIFTAPQRNETLGGALFSHYLPLPVGSSLLTNAWGEASKLRNSEQASQAKELLTSIQQSLYTLERYHYDLSIIPPLQAIVEDDGSVLFEWIFRDYRLGFGIEINPRESGWFLVTNHVLGDIAANGLIAGIDLNLLINWLLRFIQTHV